MILNTSLWKQTISEAKAKSAGNDFVLRAIDRAVVEIEKSAYWSFADGILKIKSRPAANFTSWTMSIAATLISAG